MTRSDGKKQGKKYSVIYSELREAISTGQYLSGMLLPTEMQLMEQYGVSRTTVRKAMKMLQQDGLISVVQGRGAEVIHGLVQNEQPAFSRPYDMTRVDWRSNDPERDSFSSSVVDIVQADVRIAKKLNIPPLSSVYRIQRLKFNDDVPYGYVVSYLSHESVPGLEQFSGKVMWLSKQLYDQYHIKLLYADEVVGATASTFLEANLLHIPMEKPLLLMQRTAIYENNVVEFSESFYRPDYTHLSIHMEGRPEYLLSKDPLTDI